MLLSTAYICFSAYPVFWGVGPTCLPHHPSCPAGSILQVPSLFALPSANQGRYAGGFFSQRCLSRQVLSPGPETLVFHR